MRAFLTREARERLRILRHLCFCVCDTRGLKRHNGHWDLYRGMRWSAMLELIHHQVGNRDSDSTYIQTVYIPRINVHTSSNLL